MPPALVLLEYLNWALRATCVGFLLYSASVFLSAARAEIQRQSQAAQVQVQQPQVQQQVQPQPQPQIVATPISTLSPMAAQVQGWDEPSKAQWSNWCVSTNSGAGYGQREESICSALKEIGR